MKQRGLAQGVICLLLGFVCLFMTSWLLAAFPFMGMVYGIMLVLLGIEKVQTAIDQKRLGAGDQGMMFGYACNETESLMPLPIELSHMLCKRLTQMRKDRILPYLRPDGKPQVTVEYAGDKSVHVDTVVVSAQYDPDIDMKLLQWDILTHMLTSVIPEHLLDDRT